KWDEENIGIILDIVLSNMNYGYYFDAYKLSTNTFTPLLNLVDTSSTAGHITFLPLEYLRKKVPSIKIKFENDFKEKEYLFNNLLNRPNILNTINNDIFKGIPIKCLRKPILVSDIFKNDKFSNNYDIIDKNVFKEYKQEDLFKETSSNYNNAWFYNFNVDD